MNALHQSTAMAYQTSPLPGLESARMAPGLRTGIARIKTVDRDQTGLNERHDWPGRTHGIRAPGICETALSWAEVRVALAVQA